MIKVSVVGAKGRMGLHVVEAVNNAEDTQLALALDAGDDLTQITTDNTDVVVEFTVPSVSLNNVLTLIGQAWTWCRHHRLDRRETRPGQIRHRQRSEARNPEGLHRT